MGEWLLWKGKEIPMRRGAKPATAKGESKRLVARKSPKTEGSRVRDLEKRLAEALKHAADAREQQAATAEILRVISTSPTDLQPVFETIAESAVRLCGAEVSGVLRFDGSLVHLAAYRNFSAAVRAMVPQDYPMVATRQRMSGRAILDRTVVHVPDVLSDPEYPQKVARSTGWRSFLSVPMLREAQAIGAVTVVRTRPGPFSDHQIELLKTFADQAVIAIENVRLFKELQEKNGALTQAHRQVTEALEQQTATSEILRVISQSQTDVQPVFDTIAANARRLCNASSSAVFTFDGELIHLAAQEDMSPQGAAVVRGAFPMPPGRGSTAARAIMTRGIAQITEAREDPEYVLRDATEIGEFRSVLAVPMLQGGHPIGAVSVAKAVTGPFPDKQIALLQTFADQAVIAIENVRLFKELGARNRALTDAHTQMSEALEQQTATSEILQVISASPTDLRPVFETILRSAVHLCAGSYSLLFLCNGEQLDLTATHNVTPEGFEALKGRYPLSIASEEAGFSARAVRERRLQHVADIQNEPQIPTAARRASETVGQRAAVAVPLLREGEPVGVLTVSREEPRAFSENEITLLQTFADQAVIAIENVRLFTELAASNREIAEKSHQLEVASQHKSEFLANMSHELRTPLNAVIGFSEVLLQRMFGELNAKQDEYLQDIYASGQHLLSLINDILDLSKIEAGRMELDMTDFDFPTALDNTLTLIRERAGRRGIALHLGIDGRLGQIRADERKIRQVVLNLLSNAIKFTPEGGRIDVAAVPRDEFVEVSVSDTGIGIAPEDQEAVFEEFRQVGTAAKKVEGTGLGLALSRKFIELHGGRIWVQSQLGIGSTFTFSIPVRRRE